MANREWSHVEWVLKASTRTTKDDKKVARQYRVPMPKAGSTPEQFLAELGEYSKPWYVKVVQAMRVGIPLVGQKNLWTDAGSEKVSDAKVLQYLFANVANEPYRSLLAKNDAEAAKAKAREQLSKGLQASSDDVSLEDAKATDKIYSTQWNALEVATIARMGVQTEVSTDEAVKTE